MCHESINTLQIHLNVESPDSTVIADDLDVVGEWGQQLETDAENDDDDDDETTTASDPTSQRTKFTSRTPGSVPRSSASRTATISSGQSSNATCYTGSEYPFPAWATFPAAAQHQSAVFTMLDFDLSGSFAVDPTSGTSIQATANCA